MLFHLRWALLWALLILVLCMVPGRTLPEWGWADLFNFDKLVHASLFAVLFFLLVRGVARHRGEEPIRLADLALLLAACVAYGAAVEWMQMLPALGRRGDLNDLLANTAGSLLGWAWYRWRRSRQRSAAEPSDA